MPQPKKEIDWKELNALLQFKVTLKFVCDYINVSERTLQRRIEEEHGMSFSEYHGLRMNRTGVKLQQKAIEMALAGDRTMLIFSLKNIANWSDKNQIINEAKGRLIIDLGQDENNES